LSFSSFFLFRHPSTPAISTFPYTTLFRSVESVGDAELQFKRQERFPSRAIVHRQPRRRFPDIREIERSVILASSPCDLRTIGHRSEEHTSELQSRGHLVCRLLLEKKKHNM